MLSVGSVQLAVDLKQPGGEQCPAVQGGIPAAFNHALLGSIRPCLVRFNKAKRTELDNLHAERMCCRRPGRSGSGSRTMTDDYYRHMPVAMG